MGAFPYNPPMSFYDSSHSREAPRRTWNWHAMFSVLRFVGPPLTRWYHAWKAQQKAAAERAFRLSLLKRALLLLLVAFFVFLLFAGLAKALISLRLITVPGCSMRRAPNSKRMKTALRISCCWGRAMPATTARI